MRRPRRAACSAVIAPLATTFTGSARRRSAAATNALATSMSSTTANGGSARTLKGTAGIRSTRPSGLGTCGPSTVPMRIAPTVTPTRRPIAAAVRSMPASMRP